MENASLNLIREFVYSNRNRYTEELIEFVRKPSVSATGEGLQDTAEFMKRMMEEAGLRTEVFLSNGYENNPLLLGEFEISVTRKTVCLYAHYDTCPPTSPDLWTTPPYSPTIRDERLYGAGVADDKAQAFTIIKAVEVLNQIGLDSVNILVLLEGEEEQYSPHLPEFVAAHKELLQSDVLLGADGEAHETGPLIALGLKGTLFVRILVRTGGKDHPDGYAPVVPNAIWNLIDFLSSIRSENGTILIDGFYDHVQAITPQEERLLKNIPFRRNEVLEGLHTKSLLADDDFNYYKRLYMYPSCTVTGISGGYTGKGVKNVLPSFAFANLDIQIVPDQSCEEIENKLRNHIYKNGFENVEIEILQKLGPHKINLDHPLLTPIILGIKKAYDREPVLVPCYRGAGGVGHEFLKIGIPPIWIPCLHPMDTNMHGIDENVRLQDVWKGIIAKVMICNQFTVK